jgi:zinc transport system substrate-binding protein
LIVGTDKFEFLTEIRLKSIYFVFNMIAKITKVVLVIVVSLFFACNSKRAKNNEDEQVITVSILPIETFVKKIAGDDFRVNVLLPPGASPANFTLIPSQLEDISRSKVWLRIGYIGFEYSWKEKIAQANTSMKVVNLSEGLDLIYSGKQTQNNSKTAMGVNPHTWLSPILVKQMAEVITKELIELNPGKKEVYTRNYLQFVKETEQLDQKIRSGLQNYKGRQFIMFHPSLSYFAREYGLVQHSLEPGGKEPTPQRMASLVELAQKEDIGVIYIQSDMDREQARVFAEEIDGEIIDMWPLNPAWEENLIKITDMLIDNF